MEQWQGSLFEKICKFRKLGFFFYLTGNITYTSNMQKAAIYIFNLENLKVVLEQSCTLADSEFSCSNNTNLKK